MLKTFNSELQISCIVKQTGMLNDNIVNRDVTLYLTDDNDIELNFNYSDSFSEFDDSKSRFELIVEFNSDTTYEVWEMNLKVNDLETDDFIIEKNKDYYDLIHFLGKFKLTNKLIDSLESKSVKKHSKI